MITEIIHSKDMYYKYHPPRVLADISVKVSVKGINYFISFPTIFWYSAKNAAIKFYLLLRFEVASRKYTKIFNYLSNVSLCAAFAFDTSSIISGFTL
jgi:hypothetical protein